MALSPKSLEIARTLFPSERIQFLQGPLEQTGISGPYDLIVMMDVYEHIPVDGRASFHQTLEGLRAENSRVFLSFPTPRHLRWLKDNHAEEIQPVDEDVDLQVVTEIAKDTGTELLFYQEVGIWHTGDYAHAVLGRGTPWAPVVTRASLLKRLLSLVWGRGATPSRLERIALVRKRLRGLTI